MDDLFDTPLNPQIGRVLRASSAGFAVGCRVSELSLPAFGSLVRAEPLGGGETIIGLIYDMFVDDDQLVRRLVLADDPPAAVIEDQRRNRLLPIEMSVLTIGYEVDGRLEYGLAPRPPLNLDPVFLINRSADVARFTDNVSYLRLILIAYVLALPLAGIAIFKGLETFAFPMKVGPLLFVTPFVLGVFIAILTLTAQTLKTARRNPVEALRDE